MEQMDCNLLFQWFIGLGIDDAVWGPTVAMGRVIRRTAADPPPRHSPA